MANIELLNQAIEHITQHPETWNQRKWRCGTALCLAGHVALLAHPGAEFISNDPDSPAYDWLRISTIADSTHFIRQAPISNIATTALRLTDPQAAALFHADNTLNSIKSLRDVLSIDPDNSSIAHLLSLVPEGER